MRSLKPVLLVEDDTIDALTVKRAFHDLQVACPLAHCLNGEDALNYLTEEGRETPCVILLDLNMPKMNGIEFLRVMKANPALKRIPVVVLTTSSEERDIAESFTWGVAGYIVKPVDYTRFVAAIRTLDQYWSLNELPDERDATTAACVSHAADRA
jgi:CheY-like chemotaxis protein